MFKAKSSKSKPHVRIDFLEAIFENTETCQNHFYVYRIAFVSHKSESKHAINVYLSEWFSNMIL
jgi:hypothetical protein